MQRSCPTAENEPLAFNKGMHRRVRRPPQRLTYNGVAAKVDFGFPLTANNQNPRLNLREIIFPRRPRPLEELALRTREEFRALGFVHLEPRAAQ